ncbi:MAG: hypothetical protein LAT62_05505 [Natronospirillum sp.]|uniref:FimV/HubP family polar landmark protein n=1 Tax=Natronospirillum sp. TaxID=2812955 RepID=UPI0025D11307|nr:FimV/HubP family polar landmark protein [Natronospirillum sp.]MCH8551371.1 hypothetical protein [Natronospirillum sp.]
MSRTQAVVSKMLAGFVLTVLSAVAGAVGLGEVTLRSALTEPLDAEIRITNPEDLTQAELNVSLATNADFQRAGVERPFFLSQLEFNVVPDGDGFVIEVTSSDPVEEPFLDFLVELRWPSGRLIREYTLLLDPPVFAEGDSVMEQSFPATDPFEDQPAPAPELPEVEAPSQPQPTQPERRVEDLPDSQYRVANNDTLWEIALRARQDPSQTPQQVMLAIQDMNPDAFIGGNINRVKAGSLLNLPDADQVAVRSAAEANQEVSRQNAALTGTPPATEAQITATDDTATGLADGDPARDPDGFLEVVTEPGEPGEAAAADGTDESEMARLQNELAIQQELNDELRRQYDEQQSRLGDLEEQVELLSRLMDLQSESAAQLQAAAEELERLEAEAEREEALEEEGLTEDDQPVVPAPEPITPPSDLAEAPADPDAPATPATEPGMPAEAEAPAAEAPPATTVPDLDAPVAVSPWTIVDDLVDWFRNPMNAVLVLSGLVLILGLLNLARKRRAAKADEEDLDVDDDLIDDDTDGDAGLDETADMDDDLPVDDPTVAEQSASVGGGSAAAEAIENAELYMAFQRYDEAESALKTALEQAPGEPSLQQKLLELYAETGNRSAFEKLAGSFSGSAEALDNLRAQMQGQGSDSFGSDDLSEEFGAGEFDDLDLDLDLELDEEVDQPTAPRQEAPSDLPDLDDDFEVPELDDALEDEGDGMDFDFTSEPAETKPEPEPVAASPRDEGMDLDFDLSDSELPEKTPEPERAEPANDLGGDDLDLDFDFGDLDTGEAVDSDTAWDLDTDSEPTLGKDEALDDIPELEDPFASGEDPTEDWANLTDETPVPEEELPEPQAFDQDSDSDPAPAMDEPIPEPQEPAMSAAADDEGEWDEDFDFLAGTDEIATKLDLARAYIDMEDGEGARDILNEVIEEGNDQQKSDARKLLETI